MTEEQKDLVKTSFAKVEPIAETAADLFYTRLFEIEPGLRSLFKGDMKEQGLKLMHMIGIAVKGLDRLDELVPALESLGSRHSAYGVKDEHYKTVGEALLWTLEKGLGDDFDSKTKEAWSNVYFVLANTMKNASSKKQESFHV